MRDDPYKDMRDIMSSVSFNLNKIQSIAMESISIDLKRWCAQQLKDSLKRYIDNSFKNISDGIQNDYNIEPYRLSCDDIIQRARTREITCMNHISKEMEAHYDSIKIDILTKPVKGSQSLYFLSSKSEQYNNYFRLFNLVMELDTDDH